MEIARQLDGALARRAMAARNRNTAGETVSNALWSEVSSSTVAQRPSSNHDSNDSGSNRTGAKRVRGASGESTGAGDFTKVVERTTPTRLDGGFAAIDSAI